MENKNELVIFSDGLVPIYNTSDNTTVVNGRELWIKLQSKTDFSDWIKKRLFECDAIENIDFVCFLKKKEANSATMKEYIIKLSTAKEMAMLERNDIGKQVRKYFIKVEEQSKNISLPTTYLEALKALTVEVEKNEQLLLENKQQEQQIVEMQPKVDFTDRILKSKDCILVREFAKIMQDEKVINYGEKKLYLWLRGNKYINGKNEPYQQYMKYFVVEESSINTVYGIKLVQTTKITPDGQLYFCKKLKDFQK